MKAQLAMLLLLTIQSIFAQSKIEYLSNNRIDLRQPNSPMLVERDFNVIGFGGYHGSAKTYEAELILLKSLVEQQLLDYYMVEGNLSQAYFFQKYLKSGDENLLKELTLAFQTIVTQEGTIDTFKFWQNLRSLSLLYPEKPLQVIGCDIVWEYKFPIKHILELTQDDKAWKEREALKELLGHSNLDFTVWGNQHSEVSLRLKHFVRDYLSDSEKYKDRIHDLSTFDFLISNIDRNFQDYIEQDQNRIDREKIIYENFVVLFNKLALKDKKLFAKYGFFHIQKEREDNYPSFFTQLIENGVYDKNNVITILAYFNKSKALGTKTFDENGAYSAYTTYSGVDLGDSWREHFKGIQYLKKAKISDLTLFRLNSQDSPYSKGTDLIEIKIPFKDYNTSDLQGKNTLQFMDYALLITKSSAQIPIEEME